MWASKREEKQYSTGRVAGSCQINIAPVVSIAGLTMLQQFHAGTRYQGGCRGTCAAPARHFCVDPDSATASPQQYHK